MVTKAYLKPTYLPNYLCDGSDSSDSSDSWDSSDSCDSCDKKIVMNKIKWRKNVVIKK